MTIYDLSRLNKANGGKFFSRDTMKLFGDTMKSYKLKDNKDGTVTVTRTRDGRKWEFDRATGRVKHAIQFQQKLDGYRPKYPMVVCTHA